MLVNVGHMSKFQFFVEKVSFRPVYFSMFSMCQNCIQNSLISLDLSQLTIDSMRKIVSFNPVSFSCLNMPVMRS